jgi:hypothetical protein
MSAATIRTLGSIEMSKTWNELISAPIPKTIINEPIDFIVDFTVAEEPKREETATARAMRIWFKQDKSRPHC